MLQRRWSKERTFSAKRDLNDSQKVQTRDVNTQTEEEYFPPPRSQDHKIINQSKKDDLATVTTPPVTSGPGEKVQRVLESVRETTSSNEVTRVRYQRHAKANNIIQ